jgi:regulator of protease activity HflC (stomatin/prohibitin superfamily)
VSDDLARQLADAAAPEPASDREGPPAARPYVQIVEAVSTPALAGEALEQADALGRVPVVVRIRRRAPIRPESLLIAAGLVTAALVLPIVFIYAVLLVAGAVAALVVGLLSRLLIRIPPGTVGLVMVGSKHRHALVAGAHWVPPWYVLTHLVTTREIAFDVPVDQVRTGDGVGVDVDLILTLGFADHARFVYSITPGDLDQLAQATCQDAVRTLIRGMEALSVLDLGASEADRLRSTIAGRLAPHGIEVPAVAFTRVMLPREFNDSLEGRRLAAVRLSEQEELYALKQRQQTDRASLEAQEEDARRAAVEFAAQAEEIRLARLEARVSAYPAAARYDLELARLRVAERLASNTRAIVSLGSGDLGGPILLTPDIETVAAPTTGGNHGSGGNGASPSP